MEQYQVIIFGIVGITTLLTILGLIIIKSNKK